MEKTQITIKDIAKQLNLSPSTISRALKDHPDISEKTKIAVRELASKLNYRPNTLARSLRQKRSNIIGVLIPQVTHHFFSSVLSGIEDVAYKKKFNVIISQSNENYQREVNNTYTLLQSQVDGILVSKTKETVDYTHFEDVVKNNIPIVFFDRICANVNSDKVIVDDKNAAFEATEHLINIGCKKIAHFKGPKNLEISTKRLNGYLEALKKHSIPIYDSLIIESDTIEDGREAMQKLLADENIPDGIFAVNDMTAIGAMQKIKANNMRVPEDIAIVGFTNGIISQISDPKLSTIEQNAYQIGYRATELLIERIESKKNIENRTEIIPTKLIIRESSIRK